MPTLPNKPLDAPRVLAITGGSGSGKSTVAEAVAGLLGDCAVLHQDDYYKPIPDAVSVWDHDFDHPDAFDGDRLLADLDGLIQGRRITAPLYHHGLRGPGTRTVDPAGTIIVEGILILADARLRARCDLAVYLDADENVRLRRRLLRDVAERGLSEAFVLEKWRRFTLPAHAALVETARPLCGLLLSGLPTEDAARRIVAALDRVRQPTLTSAGTPMFDALHHIAIIASDYERSKAFYVDVLGFRILSEIYREERRSHKLDLESGSIRIELFSFPDPPPRPSRPEACGLRHLAFRVAALDKAVARLTRAGVPVEETRIDPHTGRRFTFFADPDGLPLELYEEPQ